MSEIRLLSFAVTADGICLLCNFLNHRMVHPSTDDGTIRLYNDVVLSAVLNDRLLLAKRMKLEVIYSEIIS